MYTGLVHMHNLLRWVIVITLILSLINAFKGKNGKETLIMMISSHVMLLIGLIQWFGGDWGLKQIKNDYDSTSFGESSKAQHKMVFGGGVVDYFDDDARTLEVRSSLAARIVSRNVIGLFG
jgi:hypothetical protein